MGTRHASWVHGISIPSISRSYVPNIRWSNPKKLSPASDVSFIDMGFRHWLMIFLFLLCVCKCSVAMPKELKKLNKRRRPETSNVKYGRGNMKFFFNLIVESAFAARYWAYSGIEQFTDPKEYRHVCGQLSNYLNQITCRSQIQAEFDMYSWNGSQSFRTPHDRCSHQNGIRNDWYVVEKSPSFNTNH